MHPNPINLLHTCQIRDNMSYILAKASILKYEKKYDEALALLENSLRKLLNN